jgi:RNA polymerase sigma-70 factor (ECF subfamily)
MSTNGCCGRPSAADCRCHTEAGAIAKAIRAFVARRVSRPQDAEDVTQETLLRLYRNAETLDDERALEAWMYRIARNAITDHYRRSALRPPPLAPEDVAVLAPAATDDEARPDASLAACLSPLLARVPDDYRAALELIDMRGMTQEQAAARLGLSTSGMKSRVQRGRRMLRTEVARCCRIELDARGALAGTSVRDDTGAC